MPNASPLFTASPSTLSTSQNYTEGGSTTTGLFLSAAANVGLGDIEGSLPGQQLFQSVTFKVSNVFTGDQLRIDGDLVSVDLTTSSSITAGTYKVNVTVAGGVSTVTISRDPIDISSANLQTLVENIGFASTSNNPTDFGTKLTRGITIYEVKDNAGTVDPTDDLGVSPNITATVTIATVNTPVVAVNDVRTGANAAQEGSIPVLATGNALTNDVDPDSILHVTKVGSTTVAASGNTTIAGTYGTLTIDANGIYSYAADNTNTLVNSLNVGSPSLTDTFTYTVSDGPSSSTATISIDIKGGNNSAVISGDVSRVINESVITTLGTTVVGTLLAADVDNTPNTWTASTGTTSHGSYGIDVDGNWTFTLDNANSAVNGLNMGGSFVDTFNVQSIDGTSQTVSVNIIGKNDPAVITGAKTGSINESVTVLTGTSTTGTLISTDVDNTSAWTPVTSGNTAHGTYALTAAGAWTFTLDNGNTAVNSLNVGGSFVDTFTVATIDGTTQTVSVTINGQNDAAIISGTTTGSINESVTSTAGTTITGSLTSTDVDNTSAWTPVTSGNTAYGTYALNVAGTWTYTLDNGNSAVNALNVGGSFIDTFNVATIDGTTQTVSVTINGQNDAAVITGAKTGSINESVTVLTGTSTTGTLTSTDVDNTSAWTPVTSGNTAHGTYALTAAGAWTYTLDNGNSAVNALNVGGSFVDTFNVTTIDGTTQTVSVLINGQNDDAVITSGAASYLGNVTEASGLNNSVNNAPSNSRATGTVTYTDVDNFAPLNWVATAPQVTASRQGSYSIDANGNWVYNLDNAYGTVQALQTGQSTTDTFTITTVGGTTQTVTVVITGGNDLPVVTNPAALSGSVIEAGGVANGTINTPSTTANINFTDPDNTSDVWTPVAAGAATVGGYGTYGIDAFGQWTYALNNSNSAVNALNVGGSLVDTFNVTTNDGTTQTVSVTINGQNDAAVITGPLSGTITERSGLNNSLVGSGSSNYGILDNNGLIFNVVSVADVDSPAHLVSSFTGSSPLANLTASGYGSYETASGGFTSEAWAYSLNEGNATVQALNVGQSITDSFTIAAVDGTTTSVNIVIQGANDEAIVTGDINSKSVTEDKGFNNSIAGTPTVTGNLTYTDVDNAGTAWIPQSSVFTGTYGIYSITSTGAWTYTVNNNNGLVDGLQANQSLTDSFVVTTSGGTTQTVTVKILGQNDSAVITGQSSAALSESAVFTSGAATGNNLDYTDPDNTADDWIAVSSPTLTTGGHGNYTIDVHGIWNYTLATGTNIVESLALGATAIDTFVATTVDGTTKVVSITITGENDAAVITNALTAAKGSLTEAGGINNGTPGTTASADLNATDIDNTPDTWNPVTTPTNTTLGYGQYSISANGAWTYIANNSNNAVQALNVTTTLTDTFVATTIDGTTQTVTVTINGTNDTASLTGVFTGSVTEASGANNGTAGTGTITQNVTVTDVDNAPALIFTSTTSTYGFYVAGNGEASPLWNYTVNEGNANVQALNVNQTLVDTFSISAVDGTTQAVTITINGANDAASITNALTAAVGSVTEAGGLNNGTAGTTASNNLNATDVDNITDLWTVVSSGTTTYGTYSITSAGVWNYAANNGNSTVQGLNVGNSLSDTFTVTTIDGTSQTVIVTINGADDTAVISNFTGAVTEAGGTANGTPGIVTATATLSIIDPDNTYPGWTAQTSTPGTYGSYALTSAGVWTYTLNNTSSATQALTAGQIVTETFTAINGGLTQTVTITVTGTNDNPALTGTASTTPLAIYAENAVAYTITKAQLLQGFSDVDASQTATLSIASLLSPQGTFSFNSVTNVYTFTPTNPDYNGTVALTYDVKDVDNGTYGATSSFSITPVNDAPTVALTSVNLPTVSKNLPNPAGQTVGSLFASSFSDAKDSPSPDPFLGIAITALVINPSQGVWQWQDTTNVWQPIDAVSTSLALFLRASTKIRFLPGVDFTGTPESLQARLVEADSSTTPNQFKGLPTPNSGAVISVVANADPSLSNSGGATNISDSNNVVTLSTKVVPTFTKNDFNGDGRSDILFRNTNGDAYLYEVNNFGVIAEGTIRSVSNDWKIAGTGDFNGDRKADIVWRNTTSGDVYIYQMDGLAVASEGTVRQVSLDWQIAGTGDFNGDGQSDILWRNTTSGDVYIYQMNGLAVASEGTVRKVSLDWQIAGTGDFNGDGRSDILWRNSVSGDAYIYQMNGTSIAAEGTVRKVSLDWKIAGVDDFNGDGKSDILWRNVSTESQYIYQMNGSTVMSEGYTRDTNGLVKTVDNTWTIAGTGDYNGDFNGDVLWRSNATGGVYLWNQNGINIQSRDFIRGSVNANLQIAAPTI
jgi:VCBS repeat-containing protein